MKKSFEKSNGQILEIKAHFRNQTVKTRTKTKNYFNDTPREGFCLVAVQVMNWTLVRKGPRHRPPAFLDFLQLFFFTLLCCSAFPYTLVSSFVSIIASSYLSNPRRKLKASRWNLSQPGVIVRSSDTDSSIFFSNKLPQNCLVSVVCNVG